MAMLRQVSSASGCAPVTPRAESLKVRFTCRDVHAFAPLTIGFCNRNNHRVSALVFSPFTA